MFSLVTSNINGNGTPILKCLNEIKLLFKIGILKVICRDVIPSSKYLGNTVKHGTNEQLGTAILVRDIQGSMG